MAEKSKGGGGFFGFFLGLLVGIALTLGALMFMNAEPVGTEEARSAADDAAAASVETPTAVDPAQLPPPVEKPAAAPQHDAGIDPHADDQMAEDAAAAGMTSRPPSTPSE